MTTTSNAGTPLEHAAQHLDAALSRTTGAEDLRRRLASASSAATSAAAQLDEDLRQLAERLERIARAVRPLRATVAEVEAAPLDATDSGAAARFIDAADNLADTVDLVAAVLSRAIRPAVQPLAAAG